MTMPSHFLIKTLLQIALFISLANLNFITSQQDYDSSTCQAPTSSHGYVCNGARKRCQAYIIFLAQPSYQTASSIAAFLGSDDAQIAHLNNVSTSDVFRTHQEVIVPINCSCQGGYYQANTSYVVQADETPYSIGYIFQGLTSCSALQDQRDTEAVVDLSANERIVIPLRCACPTKNQTDQGIKYLMTYVVQPGDSVPSIAQSFGVEVGELLQANGLDSDGSLLISSTTLLIPLWKPPSVSVATQTSHSAPPPPVLLYHYDPVILCIH